MALSASLVAALAAGAIVGLNPPADCRHHMRGMPRAHETTNNLATTEEFLDSIGMNTHMGAVKTEYGDVGAVVRDLRYLDIHHVRDSFGGMTSGTLTNGQWNGDPTPKLTAFAAAGIKFDVILAANFAAEQAGLDKYADFIDAIEGPNEPEFSSLSYEGLTKIPAAAAVQKDLYPLVKGDPALRDKPVLQFSFAHSENSKTVGDLSRWADFANIHTYAGHGAAPHTQIPVDIADSVSAPGRRVIITETGYPTNDPAGPPGARLGQGHNFVDEDVQTRYLLDAALDDFRMGVARTYLYALYDAPGDPQNTDQEAHFGLIRADGTKKPSAVSLHNLDVILQSGGPPVSPSPRPSWTLQQDPADPTMDVSNYNLLLRKPDGDYDLILWGEPRIWTAQLQRAPDPIPNTVTVNFAHPYHSIATYDPLAGSRPVASIADTASVTVSISDHPVVIELSDR